ncbi:MAG: hypothetical protein RL758_213 [Pseudomonadota bacterium]|jgi:hypothetical protein
MGSLFQGEPQKATSYVTSTTETPKWLQDAIYNQIYQATNVANTPFTPYSGTLVAGATPQQKQAYEAVSANQGLWKAPFETAQTGLEKLTTAPGAVSAATPYMTQAAGMSPLQAAQGLITQATGTTGVGAAQPFLNQQAAALAGVDTSTGARTLSPYVQASLEGSGLTAAAPYMQQAAQTTAQDIGQFFNPYTESVTNQIAKLGARNLQENLLPSVSDAFIRAGQFGGTRMGEFGGRALRDTQESILNQQSQALQAGYGQAVSAAQQEAARQAQLASTAGGLGTAQQQAILSGGQALTSAQQQAAQQEIARAQALGGIGTQLGGLTQAQQQALLSAAQQTGALTGQQQQLLASLGSQAGQLTQADLQRQQSTLQQMAAMAQQGQQMRTTDAAALEAAGAAQQQLAQREADVKYQQYLTELQYPKSQLDWLSTQVRGMAPNVQSSTTQTGQTTGQTYSASPLQQLATGLSASAGLSKLLGG